MVYVALLRGINVGGKNKVPMAELKAIFEKLGFTRVRTFIASGNVIFCSDSGNQKQMASRIEHAIFKEFRLDIPVVLRTQSNIAKLVQDIPAGWNNAQQRTEVMFLWDEVNKPEILDGFKWNPKIETLRYYDGAVVWNIDRKHYKQGSGPKIIKSDFYKKMTGRNINTVRKLDELMHP